ncbi:MAG: type II toxin-antitoxin system VapC family toxin [Promethearchaeota archaeon]
MTHLFDASAIFSIIESKRKDALYFLNEKRTISLAFYEMGNVIWKHVKRKTITKEEGINILKMIECLPQFMKVKRLDEKDITEIFKAAELFNISFYDASYYYYAKKYKTILVTDDKRLKDAIGEDIFVIDSNKLD